MVGEFYASGGIAVDLGSSRKFAMAGLAAVHAYASVAIDDSIGHQHSAGMDDLQAKRPTIESDLVVTIDIALSRVEKSNSNTGIVADDVRRARRAVAAVQNQMGGGGADAAAPIVGDCHTRIQVKRPAAHAEAGAHAGGDQAIR